MGIRWECGTKADHGEEHAIRISHRTTVVCIDGDFHPSVYNWGTTVPIFGHVYTVRALVANGQNPPTGERGLASTPKRSSTLRCAEICASRTGGLPRWRNWQMRPSKRMRKNSYWSDEAKATRGTDRDHLPRCLRLRPAAYRLRRYATGKRSA